MLLENRRSTRRGGLTLVETSVVILACLIFLFAIFEYGRFTMMRHLLDNAAREGARVAVVNTDKLTTADIQNTVTNFLAGQSLETLTVQVYKANPTTGTNIGAWNDAAFGEAIAVEATGTYEPILPTLGLLPSPVDVRAKVIMRSEAN